MMKQTNVVFTKEDLVQIAKDRAMIHVKNIDYFYGGKLSPMVSEHPSGDIVVSLIFEEKE